MTFPPLINPDGGTPSAFPPVAAARAIIRIGDVVDLTARLDDIADLKIKGKDGTVGSAEYPYGLSFMTVGSDQSGWPATTGTVVTWVGARGAGQRIFQLWIPKTVTANGQIQVRTRNSDDTAWTSFFTV